MPLPVLFAAASPGGLVQCLGVIGAQSTEGRMNSSKWKFRLSSGYLGTLVKGI